jgi:hypothetical protein
VTRVASGRFEGVVTAAAEPQAARQMTDIPRFVATARRQLAPILDRSGAILFSGVETLCPGSVYLIGLNPGGDPRRHRSQTIRQVLEDLPARYENDYYFRWGNRPQGESTLQRRVRRLADMLDVELQAVCATNLIFVRSRDARSCGYPELAEQCWPVHRAILDIVQPKLVVCFGNSFESPYTFLCQKLRATDEDTFPSGHGKWQCRVSRSSQMRVAGLPHLSRYAVDRHPRVGRWLRGLLAT